MAGAPLSPELVSALRDQAFEELERLGNRAASYSRSLAEAAYRGDEATVEVHLRQLRLCVLELIQLYKGLSDGEDAGRNRQDRRPGDGVA
jgi:hypothetical protein